MSAAVQYFIVALPVVVFSFGITGVVVWRKNFILILLALEICFMASNIGFVLWSMYVDDIFGLIFCMTGLALTGAEVSLGLALAIIMHKRFDSIQATDLKNLRT